MGAEARRKEIAGDLRRKIGGQAAEAVAELRKLLVRVERDMRALAVGMAAMEKRVDAAAAAPAKLRDQVGELDEQLAALRLRVGSLDNSADSLVSTVAEVFDFYKRLYGRVDDVARRIDDLQRAVPAALFHLQARQFEELARVPRWRWWRRRALLAHCALVADVVHALMELPTPPPVVE